MKTIQQALLDAVYYPIGVKYVENVMISRNLDAEEECTPEVINSKEFMGAVADCLYSLIQAVNFSEAYKSVGTLSDKQLTAILSRANSIYESIGEKPKDIEPKPMVYVGDCLL